MTEEINTPRTKVTNEDIEKQIKYEHYINVGKVLGASSTSGLNNLTICILEMENGFKAVGKSSCVCSFNFNEQIGKDFARKDAIEQIWPLLGYELLSAIALEKKVSEATA